MYICPVRTCELGEGFDLSDIPDSRTTQPVKRITWPPTQPTVYRFCYSPLPDPDLEDSDDDPFDPA